MYTFDVDEEASRQTYAEVSRSYNAVCSAIFGCEGSGGWSRVLADTGNIGGELSHEYQVHAEIGEDLLLHCECCLHSANQEKMSSLVGDSGKSSAKSSSEFGEEKGEGNGTNVIEDENQTWRGVRSDGSIVDIVVSGVEKGREVNPLKVQSMFDLMQEPMPPQSCGEEEEEEEEGATSTTEVIHIKHDGVNMDILLAMPGDQCPSCNSHSSTLVGTRGIEIGHVFHLGTKYSSSFNATYQNKNGRSTLADMGCYGIGKNTTCSRLLLFQRYQ